MSPRRSAITRRRFVAGLAAPAALALAVGSRLPVFAAENEPRAWRVGLQAGHWNAAEMPAEQARMRTQTGTYGGGWNEWELNLAVARRAAAVLEEHGIVVDVLPATIPPGYSADAFVALHADGDATGRLSGFKAARSRRSVMPETDDALLALVEGAYAEATGLPLDPNISRNMTGYYAFSPRFVHAISPRTPAVILEMGFMTNWSDVRFMTTRLDLLAWGVAAGVLRFLRAHR